jgi:hypothetical protein
MAASTFRRELCEQTVQVRGISRLGYRSAVKSWYFFLRDFEMEAEGSHPFSSTKEIKNKDTNGETRGARICRAEMWLKVCVN